MYNLIEYSDIYSKASGCLWQQYRDEPVLDNINNNNNNNNSICSEKGKNNLEKQIIMVQKIWNNGTIHCVKSAQIRIFFWSVFGHFSRSD